MTATIDTSPEAVARMVKRLRGPQYWMSGSDEGHEGENAAPYEAADMLEALIRPDAKAVPALAARVAELEAERDSFRAVLEGARYGGLDSIGRNTVEQSRDLGEAVMHLTLAQRTRAEAAEAKVARLTEAMLSIVRWSDAYPTEAFHEPDFARAATALSAAGMSLDAVSASNMRHATKGVGAIARAALEETKE